jgi:hypothetical protein
MLPLVKIVDMRTLPPIELTIRDDILPVKAPMVDAFRVEIVNEGNVGLFWISGTHWPNI